MDFATYIKNKQYESRVDEGFMDSVKKLFKNDGKSESVSLFSFAFGRISSLFMGKETATEKAIRDTLAQKLKDDKDRVQKIKDAKDAANAEKIRARAEGEKNRLDLKANKKINAYKALEKEYSFTKNFFKNNTLDMSDEERNAIYNQMDKSFRELNDPSEMEAAEKIKHMTDFFMIDENGNLRSKAELEEFMNKHPEELKNLQEIVKSTDKSTAESVEVNADFLAKKYQESAKEVANVMSNKEIEKEEKDLQEKQDLLDNNSKLAETYSTKKSTLKSKDEALATLESKKPKFNIGENGEVIFDENADSNFFTGSDSDLKDGENWSDDKVKAKIKEYYKALGATPNEADIDAMVSKFNDIDEGASIGKLNDLFKEHVNKTQSIKDEAKTAKTKYGTDLKKAQDEKKTAEEDLQNFKEDNPNVNDQFEIDFTGENKTNLQKQLDDRRKQLDNHKVENQKQIDERKEAYKVAQEVAMDSKVPQDVKNKIKEEQAKYDGLEPGEEIRKGEVGYEDENGEWHKKPSAKNMDNEERNKYKENLEKTLVKKPLITNNSEVVYRDGKYIKITTQSDGGKIEKEVSESEYVKYKANRPNEQRTELAQKKAKREKLDGIKQKYMDNKGNLKIDTIDNLSEKEKKELLNDIKDLNVILGDDKDSERITGDWTNLEKKLKRFADEDDADNREEEDSETGTTKDGTEVVKVDGKWYKKDDLENGKPKENVEPISDDDVTGDEFEDDDEHTEVDGEDFDEEGEETAKDENGNPLKKGKNGKWYKEGDLDKDGNPNEGVEPIPDENVTNDKTEKKTKIQNPSKKYKRRRNKRTKKLTKNYYNKDGESISPKEYKERLKNYQEKLAKRKDAEKAGKKKSGETPVESFTGYIKGQLINETKSNYGKFRQYLKEILK
jgi:hypothetical protein